MLSRYRYYLEFVCTPRYIEYFSPNNLKAETDEALKNMLDSFMKDYYHVCDLIEEEMHQLLYLKSAKKVWEKYREVQKTCGITLNINMLPEELLTPDEVFGIIWYPNKEGIVGSYMDFFARAGYLERYLKMLREKCIQEETKTT